VLPLADAAVSSDFFWAYLKMLVVVGDTMLHLHHWAETCPCHESHRLVLEHKLIASPVRCPLLGRRAPEICCGDLDGLLDTLYETPLAQLGAEFAGVADWHQIVADFHTIRLLFVQTIRLKTMAMRTLPRVLIGMAHHDVGKARQACGNALRRLWGNISVQRFLSHPPVSPWGHHLCRVPSAASFIHLH